MRRSLLKRATAVLMSLLFLLAGVGELFGSHLCPQHDPVAYHAEHDGDAAPGAHQHDQPGEPGDTETGHEHCTCQGLCPTSSPAGLPAGASLSVEVALDWVPVARVVAAEVVLSRSIPFFLPYAQAPPLLG